MVYQTSIIIPNDAEKQRFIVATERIFAEAGVYADRCVALLVEQYGANRAGINRNIFYHGAIGRIVMGAELLPPAEQVQEEIRAVRPECLGPA